MPRMNWVAAVVLGVLAAVPARATWSIIITDTRTGEIAVGSATCVTRINLQRDTPVLRVGIGAATAQSFVDVTGANRELIWAALADGVDPDRILVLLRENEGRRDHNTRQYGIVDTLGRAATFSGNRNGAFAGGRTGRVGSLAYAVQGNVITGMEVVDAAAEMIENFPGDLPDKLMAAMEAAYCYGGDGRCSCDQGAADSCGAPPPGLDCEGDLTLNPKSAHVGYIIVARRGDTDGTCDANLGCASGEYFLSKNVRGSDAVDPDPVLVLRERFENWRDARRGEPDQVESLVTLSDAKVLRDDAAAITMRIELRDWDGQPPTGVEQVEVLHDPAGSSGTTQIGALNVLDAANHIYEVELVSGDAIGVDNIAVRVTYDGGRQRYLMPGGLLTIQDPRADFNTDGQVDWLDLAVLLGSYGGPGPSGDFNGDGSVNIVDLAEFLRTPGIN